MKSIIIKTFFLPFTFCVLLFSFYFSPTYAQEVTNFAVKSDEKSGIEKPNSTEAVGNQINFKNETGNAIITITDEGNKIGSITLPSGSAPSTTSNKLYNVGGILNFNGTSLGSGGVSEIDDLSDARYFGFSLFLGAETGAVDDGSSNYNVGIGYRALYSNTTGYRNTANGSQSLYSNTTGYRNTANGYQSLYSNTTGNENTANGVYALFSNTTGFQNTANGNQALYHCTSGDYNTANGYQALYSNTSGGANTANGFYALYSNTIGLQNTANGLSALDYNTTGSYNTAIGSNSGPNTGGLSNTTALGYAASTTASNHVRIGNSSVTSIGGQVGWTTISDGRYKRNIKENVSGLDFILGLRPVTYNFDINAIAEKLGEDMQIDENGNRTKVAPEAQVLESRESKSNKRQIGFIAQEVEQLVNKLGIDFSGVEVPENEETMYSLRYSEFVVPLVKAVQEQQKMISNQNLLIEKLTNRIDELEKR